MVALAAASEVDSALSALADPVRRQAVDLLRRGPRSAGDLASTVGVSPPLMSRHLRLLRESGLVDCSFLPTDARVRLYRLRAMPLAALRDWLEGFDTHWGEQLAAFKAHAERGKGRRK